MAYGTHGREPFAGRRVGPHHSGPPQHDELPTQRDRRPPALDHLRSVASVRPVDVGQCVQIVFDPVG